LLLFSKNQIGQIHKTKSNSTKKSVSESAEKNTGIRPIRIQIQTPSHA